MRRGRFGELHLAGCGIEASDVVGLFVGEPQDAVVIEDGRVWIDFGLVGRAVLADVAGLGVELADVSGGDRSEPDVALPVGDEAVRSRVRRLERIFLEGAGGRIEAAEFVGRLSGVPERAVGRECRIVRARFGRGNIVLLDLNGECADRGEGKRRAARP